MIGTTINEAGPLHPDATHDVAMILAYLGALPADADGIAEYLRERSCFGEPGEACACPVAAYLAADVYGVVTVNTVEIGVAVNEWEFKVTTPTPVIAFITNFDAGAYPFLYRPKAGA